MKFISISEPVPYAEASRFQKDLVDRRARDEIEDTVLFLEHTPVITRGRGLQFTGVPRDRHLPLPAVLPPGVDFCESERGGDLTYHGPGQLVIYPIFKIKDLGEYLRGLEQVMIDELCSLGLDASAKPSATGVWVGERKVASIGIAVRRWVTYHGIAINGVNDLKPFHLISPCGFSPEVMTRLVDLLPAQSELQGKEWRSWLEARLSRRWTHDQTPAVTALHSVT